MPHRFAEVSFLVEKNNNSSAVLCATKAVLPCLGKLCLCIQCILDRQGALNKPTVFDCFSPAFALRLLHSDWNWMRCLRAQRGLLHFHGVAEFPRTEVKRYLFLTSWKWTRGLFKRIVFKNPPVHLHSCWKEGTLPWACLSVERVHMQFLSRVKTRKTVHLPLAVDVVARGFHHCVGAWAPLADKIIKVQMGNFQQLGGGVATSWRFLTCFWGYPFLVGLTGNHEENHNFWILGGPLKRHTHVCVCEREGEREREREREREKKNTLLRRIPT